MNKYLEVGEKKKEEVREGRKEGEWMHKQEDGICKDIPSSNVVKDF